MSSASDTPREYLRAYESSAVIPQVAFCLVRMASGPDLEGKWTIPEWRY